MYTCVHIWTLRPHTHVYVYMQHTYIAYIYTEPCTHMLTYTCGICATYIHVYICTDAPYTYAYMYTEASYICAYIHV